MENNYSVYQHVTPDGMYYFGQTQNVERRWEANGIHYKTTSLQPYIEQYGWDNIQHIVLFRDQTRENALWIEDFLITTAQEDGVCINKKRSGLVSKEEGYNKNQCNQYYKQNREKLLEQKQEYYQKNKQQILEQQNQYYEENKQQIREKQKQYYEENKQQIREKQKQYYKKYYEQNKDKIREYQEQNKDKKREYQREYYKRKKLEKQLKEVETPLF